MLPTARNTTSVVQRTLTTVSGLREVCTPVLDCATDWCTNCSFTRFMQLSLLCRYGFCARPKNSDRDNHDRHAARDKPKDTGRPKTPQKQRDQKARNNSRQAAEGINETNPTRAQ